MRKSTLVGPLRQTQADRREAAESALLEAAVSLIASRGVKRTTLADVGEAAGYSRGIAAHYFKTKVSLLRATTKFISERNAELLETKSCSQGLDTIIHIVSLLCSRQSMERSKAVLFLQKEAFFPETGLTDVMRKFNRQAVGRITDEIKIGVKNKEIRKGIDPVVEANLVLALARGVSAQCILYPDTVDLQEMKADMSGLLRIHLGVDGVR